MQPINALSLTPGVNAWLTNSRQPRILHIFDRACNLINERREVLSVVTPQIGNGPFNLVIPRLRKSFGGLSDGNESWQTSEVFSDLNLKSLLSISPNQLHLGDLTINIDHAKLWSPRPNWERLHVGKENILSQLTKLTIVNYQFSNSPISNPQFSNSLVSALANADLSSSLTAAQQLAGLGIGLTPAGDDFIMGAIYAAWIIHPQEVASVLAKEIADTAAPLTTSLSAAYLKSAGKGEAGILWHYFFDTLIGADPARIQTAMHKLLAVGETSGVDALAGFMGAFISYAESDTKLCPS